MAQLLFAPLNRATRTMQETSRYFFIRVYFLLLAKINVLSYIPQYLIVYLGFFNSSKAANNSSMKEVEALPFAICFYQEFEN